MGLTEKLYGTIPKRFPSPGNDPKELDSDDSATSSSVISTASGGRYRMTPIATGKGSKGQRNKLAKRSKTPKQLEEEIIEEAEDEAEQELEQEYDNISFASRTGSEPVQIREPPLQYPGHPADTYDQPVLEQYYKHQAPLSAQYESVAPPAESTTIPAQHKTHRRHRQQETWDQPNRPRHKYKSAEPAAAFRASRKHGRAKTADTDARSACSCGSEETIHASSCDCYACSKQRKRKHRSRKHGLSRKLERLHQAEEGARCHCTDCKKKRYKAKLKKEIMQEIETRQRQDIKHRHWHALSRHRRRHDRYDTADSRTEVEYIPVPVRRHRGHRLRGYRNEPVTRADLESLAYELRRQRAHTRRSHHHQHL